MDDEFAGALAACATIDAVKALFSKRCPVGTFAGAV